MDTVQVAIWVATVAGLSGLAVAFLRSERTTVRLGALGAFAIFYLAVLLWAPLDTLWFNLTTGSLLVITLGSRAFKNSNPRDAASPQAPIDPAAAERKDHPHA